VTFSIKNLIKSDSLYNLGMKPLVWSLKHEAATGEQWHRDGTNISYTKSFEWTPSANFSLENGKPFITPKF